MATQEDAAGENLEKAQPRIWSRVEELSQRLVTALSARNTRAPNPAN